MGSLLYQLLTSGLVFSTVVSLFPLNVERVPLMRRYLRWLDKLVLRSRGGVTWNAVIVSFILGWLTTELTPQVVVFHAVVTSVLFFFGVISYADDYNTAIVQAVCIAILIVLYVLSGRSHHLGHQALTVSLGEDYHKKIKRHKRDKSLSLYEMVRTVTVLPVQRHPSVTRARDVQYSDEHPRLKVDFIYDRRKPKNAPVFFYVHGGAWVRGEKTHAPVLLAYLAARGYVCVSTNYRLGPKHDMMTMVQDLKRSLVFVKQCVAEYGGDPNFIVVGGGSAGGHLSSLLALSGNDPMFQPGFEDEDTSVQGCVSLYGVYNMYDQVQDDGGSFARFVERVLVKESQEEKPELFKALSPIHRITKDSPPFLVIHGTVDNLVPTHVAHKFVDRFLETHASSKYVTYIELPGAHHAFDITPSLRSWQTNAHILNFLDYWHSVHVDAQG